MFNLIVLRARNIDGHFIIGSLRNNVFLPHCRNPISQKQVHFSTTHMNNNRVQNSANLTYNRETRLYVNCNLMDFFSNLSNRYIKSNCIGSYFLMDFLNSVELFIYIKSYIQPVNSLYLVIIFFFTLLFTLSSFDN